MAKEFNFEPVGRGFPVTLHWQGEGWYGEYQSNNRVWARHIPGYDRDGFPEDGEGDLVWNHRQSLGTPFYLESPQDYGRERYQMVD